MWFDFIYIFDILNIELGMNIQFLALSKRNNIDFCKTNSQAGVKGKFRILAV